MRQIKLDKTSWIALAKPGQDDIRELQQRFPEIHPLVLEELLTPTIRPRVEHYERHLYMVLHFPKVLPDGETITTQEIDFILMKDTLITVQYDATSLLEEFMHECEHPEVAARFGETPIHLLYYMLRELFAESLIELDRIQGLIDEIEERIFSGDGKEIAKKTSILKRNVLDFRRAIKPELYTFESLRERATEFYGPAVRPFLIDLAGEHQKVWTLLENHEEALDALFETNNALIADRTSTIIKILTILASFTFPLTLITGIFGMNTDHMPIVNRPNGFWIIIGIMAVSVIIMVTIFKKKKWL
ncbi:MAG: magnesium transporter CorA family protein [Candidatus Sungbacteria bacterium]|nr:magnesium transporter CorA family protein [Candidatus Sungbacteria bacterium]